MVTYEELNDRNDDRQVDPNNLPQMENHLAQSYVADEVFSGISNLSRVR